MLPFSRGICTDYPSDYMGHSIWSQFAELQLKMVSRLSAVVQLNHFCDKYMSWNSNTQLGQSLFTSTLKTNISFQRDFNMINNAFNLLLLNSNHKDITVILPVPSGAATR